MSISCSLGLQEVPPPLLIRSCLYLFVVLKSTLLLYYVAGRLHCVNVFPCCSSRRYCCFLPVPRNMECNLCRVALIFCNVFRLWYILNYTFCQPKHLAIKKKKKTARNASKKATGIRKLATFVCSNFYTKPANVLKFHIYLKYSISYIYSKFQCNMPINMAITRFFLSLSLYAVCEHIVETLLYGASINRLR